MKIKLKRESSEDIQRHLPILKKLKDSVTKQKSIDKKFLHKKKFNLRLPKSGYFFGWNESNISD